MNLRIPLIVWLIFISCNQASEKQPEKIQLASLQDDNCNSPDADVNCCFVYMPEKITRVMSLADESEKGERLHLTGRVYQSDGRTPYAGVILYAYQTDETGRYTKKGNENGIQKWHGRLHGWCKTDDSGKYEIRTIRPAPYPGNTNPAHIHAVIKEPGGKEPYYIKDFVFADDKLVTQDYLSREYGKGQSGLVELQRMHDSSWYGERNLVLKGN